MKKRLPSLLLGMLAASMTLVFSQITRAECDPMTVRQIIEDGGWTFEAETNENGEGVFKITSDGITASVLVERDGDTQFIAYYIDNGLSRQEAFEWINEASYRLNYVQMWLDKEDDLAVMYSVAEWNNVCPSNFNDQIQLYFSLMKSVGELHPANKM